MELSLTKAEQLHDLIRRKKMYRRPPDGYIQQISPQEEIGNISMSKHLDNFIVIILCLQHENFLIHLLRCLVPLTLCLKVRA